jgi:tetratricopeptide (TPR) repeat protein
MDKSDDFRPILITGASGGGKSALLANWTAAYAATHPETLLHLHHLGAGADAADPVKLMTRLLQEIACVTGDELKLESDPQKLFDLLPEWLARGSAFADRQGREWLLVFDGLDKLSSLRDLRWWPAMLPPKVKLVVSCLGGEVLESLRKRMEWTELAVLPLSQAEQRTFITEFLARYRKSLTPTLVERVQAHDLAGNPLFLLTLLEELRVFGVHEELAQRLSFYLASDTVDDLFERVLERVEGDTSPEAVRATMEAIWASRAGLAQDELLAITGLVPATWAPIHNALDEAILESGGRLTFGHDYFRKAVEDRFLPAPGQQQQAHLRLAEWFDQQEVTARAVEELPWQWQRGGDDTKLKECLTQREVFIALHARDDYELLGYWLALTGENPEANYEDAWEEWSADMSGDERSATAYGLSGFLTASGCWGDFTEEVCRSSIAFSEAIHVPTDPTTINALLRLGSILLEKGNYEEAELVVQHALIAQGGTLGTSHLQTFHSARIIGIIRHEKGDYAGSKTFYLRAMNGFENALGADHLCTLACANNLGNLCLHQGAYDEAEKLYRRALAGNQKILGTFHPDTLGLVNNLGRLLLAKGDRDGAELLYRQALAADEKVLGPEHPDTLAVLANLGCLLREKGDYNGSEELTRRALGGMAKSLGPEHPDTLLTGSTLATILRHKGDHEGAETKQCQALAALEATLGTEHPKTLGAVNSLGVLHYEQGDYENAEKFFRRTLEGRERSLGPDHPHTLQSAYSLGIVLRETRDYEEAKNLFRRVLVGQEMTFGPEHPDTLASLSNLARTLRDKGDFNEAEKFYRKILSLREKISGLDHPDTWTVVIEIGTLRIDQGDFEDGVRLYRLALAGFEKRMRINCEETAYCAYVLGVSLWKIGKLEESEAIFRRAVAGYQQASGSNAETTLQSVSGLGCVLMQMNRVQDACELLSGYASISEAGMNLLRYDLACYECLSGNEDRARQLVSEELSTSDAPAARKAQMLDDADLASISDFILNIPVR